MGKSSWKFVYCSQLRGKAKYIMLKDSSILGCYSVSTGQELSMFRMIVVVLDWQNLKSKVTRPF